MANKPYCLVRFLIIHKCDQFHIKAVNFRFQRYFVIYAHFCIYLHGALVLSFDFQSTCMPRKPPSISWNHSPELQTSHCLLLTSTLLACVTDISECHVQNWTPQSPPCLPCSPSPDELMAPVTVDGNSDFQATQTRKFECILHSSLSRHSTARRWGRFVGSTTIYLQNLTPSHHLELSPGVSRDRLHRRVCSSPPTGVPASLLEPQPKLATSLSGRGSPSDGPQGTAQGAQRSLPFRPLSSCFLQPAEPTLAPGWPSPHFTHSHPRLWPGPSSPGTRCPCYLSAGLPLSLPSRLASDVSLRSPPALTAGQCMLSTSPQTLLTPFVYSLSSCHLSCSNVREDLWSQLVYSLLSAPLFQKIEDIIWT